MLPVAVCIRRILCCMGQKLNSNPLKQNKLSYCLRQLKRIGELLGLSMAGSKDSYFVVGKYLHVLVLLDLMLASLWALMTTPDDPWLILTSWQLWMERESSKILMLVL
jgi:hypothetical protein